MMLPRTRAGRASRPRSSERATTSRNAAPPANASTMASVIAVAGGVGPRKCSIATASGSSTARPTTAAGVHVAAASPMPGSLAPGPGRFICRGCYFIYDEGRAEPGRAPPFAQLGEDWRCPDCGTDTGSFRPYLPALG